MRDPSVLIVHNRYLERGGEEAVFEAEASLLEVNGHRVGRLLFDNQALPAHPSAIQKAGLAFETVWSNAARQRLQQAIDGFRPDVVHFHNTLPRVSPAAYAVAKASGAAVVQTLHNFRLVCANGLMYRDGHPCEDCLGKTFPLPALQHSCYRGSRTQTAAVVAMLAVHRARGTWLNDVDLYISPSEFLREKLVAGGLPRDRVVVKPNFVAPDPGMGRGDGGYVLFVGRLTAAKGIETLLEAYRLCADLPPVHVAGDGELAPALRIAAALDSRIVYKGRLHRDGVMQEMDGAACLVFPSRWYENFPVTIVEAFARGLPVVASRLGAIASIVDDRRTGRLFRAGSAADLADKLTDTLTQVEPQRRMGVAARDEYLQNYTGERNYAALTGIYEQALGGRVPALKRTLAAHVI
ncbi:MAG TPA: glycosyltransferase [Dehalococcoidia bacterium]|nr:glycosyltransferase [Dehalococcoidia bacterium]